MQDKWLPILKKFIADGCETVQLKLKGDLAMVQGFGGIGPGKLAPYEGFPGFFVITVQAAMQTSPQAPPKPFQMPILFHAEDVMWISTGPEKIDEPLIATPAETGIQIPRA